MGNCQAVDAATLIIQHPTGRVDKFYWPLTAGDVMKSNPGHYVALLLSSTLYHNNQNPQSCPNKSAAAGGTNNSLRITRIKILRPTDTLLLGHAYRLITSQEVMKGLSAKKQAKLSKNHNPQSGDKVNRPGLEKDCKVISGNERSKGRNSSTGSNSGRIKTWQPSLNSISESSS